MCNQHILFVICANNNSLLEIAKRQIDSLYVPPGYQKEVLILSDVKSMASGYNIGLMKKAKYKVYLHQDTFIVYQNMIVDMINIFSSDSKLGLIGLAGCLRMPNNGIWWEGKPRIGQVIEYRRDTYQLLRFDYGFCESAKYIEVDAIDGFFMATQYDLYWREDLFDGFHFYDSSQSYEFKRAGYKVGVPVSTSPWCIHYNGDDFDYEQYNLYRNAFLNEYSVDINASGKL